MNKSTQGLSIVEVLVAIFLLGFIVVLTAQPLINSLNISGRSSTTLTATRIAQDVLERARAAVLSDYDKPAAKLAALTNLQGSTVTCADVSISGTATTGCANAVTFAPFMRRVTVTTPETKELNVVLVLDVRP